jgi:Ca2+-binding EF-hand superfamily protein
LEKIKEVEASIPPPSPPLRPPPPPPPRVAVEVGDQEGSGLLKADSEEANAFASAMEGHLRQSLADEHAECAICYVPLCDQDMCLLVSDSEERVCTHFFHTQCVSQWFSSCDDESEPKTCPCCRREAHGSMNVPVPEEDPDGWFKCMDFDNDGGLSKTEVRNALMAQIPLNEKLLEEAINKFWHRWDPDNSGEISKEEMLDPQRGLLAFVRNTRELARTESRAPPALSNATKIDFFDFWDEDESGTLEKEEVTRALLKTFGLSSQDIAKVGEMRDIVNKTWFLFDHDGDGIIDRNEFVAVNGLADAVIEANNF